MSSSLSGDYLLAGIRAGRRLVNADRFRDDLTLASMEGVPPSGAGPVLIPLAGSPATYTPLATLGKMPWERK